MKQWVNPELLNLEIRYTAHGGTNKKNIDAQWSEVHDFNGKEELVDYTSHS